MVSPYQYRERRRACTATPPNGAAQRIVDAIATALDQQIERDAVIAEELYNHRDEKQKKAYYDGEFTLDHESAGDCIAYTIRQQGAR